MSAVWSPCFHKSSPRCLKQKSSSGRRQNENSCNISHDGELQRDLWSHTCCQTLKSTDGKLWYTSSMKAVIIIIVVITTTTTATNLCKVLIWILAKSVVADESFLYSLLWDIFVIRKISFGHVCVFVSLCMCVCLWLWICLFVYVYIYVCVRMYAGIEWKETNWNSFSFSRPMIYVGTDMRGEDVKADLFFLLSSFTRVDGRCLSVSPSYSFIFIHADVSKSCERFIQVDFAPSALELLVALSEVLRVLCYCH